MTSLCFKLGCISGAVGVMLGAFGAHGLKNSIKDPAMLKNWDTAAHYQFLHSFALLITGMVSKENLPTAGLFFLGGIALFSGSLYTMTLTGQKWLGAITPIGGTAFIIGWLLLAVAR
eukprot:Phypoly_transcript_23931.p1 GENE.Phypoly_transcript_23931~~Phypoly_transcript_23931.p1  ORF type:complete len:117 (+),score=17.79 Phypoly_transcript_23931:113-463(+)